MTPEMARCPSRQGRGHVARTPMPADAAAWVREHVIGNFYADYDGGTNQTLPGPSDFYTRDDHEYAAYTSDLCYCVQRLCALVGTRRRRDGYRLRYALFVWLPHARDPYAPTPEPEPELRPELPHIEPARVEPVPQPEQLDLFAGVST